MLRVLGDPSAPDVLELLDPFQLGLVDAVLVVDEAVGIRQRHGCAAQAVDVLHRKLCNVAGTGDEACLLVDAVLTRLEHLLGEVHGPITRRLRPDETAAPLDRLAGENAAELVGQLLVLPEEVADLASPNTNVASGHVSVGTDVAEQLAHERLAETHHLAVAAALRIEVRSAFPATDRDRGQPVLEDLLKGQELENAEVDRRMKAETALVGTDRAAHLDPVAAVDVDFSGVVHPGHAEHDHPLGLDHPIQHLGLSVLGMNFEDRPDGLGHLAYGLMELGLARIASHNALDEVGERLVHTASGRRGRRDRLLRASYEPRRRPQ